MPWHRVNISTLKESYVNIARKYQNKARLKTRRGNIKSHNVYCLYTLGLGRTLWILLVSGTSWMTSLLPVLRSFTALFHLCIGQPIISPLWSFHPTQKVLFSEKREKLHANIMGMHMCSCEHTHNTTSNSNRKNSYFTWALIYMFT